MTPDDHDRMTWALHTTAHAVLAGQVGDETSEATLGRLVRAAADVVTAADAIELSLVAGQGTATTYAATGHRAGELAELTRRCGQGPCLDVATSGAGREILCRDLTAPGAPWPALARRAVDEHQMRSVLSLEIAAPSAPAGALSFWSHTPDAFDLPARTIAAGLADQAMLTVVAAQRGTQLHQALATRDVIGRAKGMLMQRYTIGDRPAFELLVRISQQSHVKLRDVASRLCADNTADPVLPPNAAAPTTGTASRRPRAAPPNGRRPA